VPLWTATIASMASRACARDWLPSFRLTALLFISSYWPFNSGPSGPASKIKSEALQTEIEKPITRTCPTGHGSDGSGPKWHAPPCSECAAQERVFCPRRGGDYNEAPQALQKKSRPSPSEYVTPFECEPLSEQGFGFLSLLVSLLILAPRGLCQKK